MLSSRLWAEQGVPSRLTSGLTAECWEGHPLQARPLGLWGCNDSSRTTQSAGVRSQRDVGSKYWPLPLQHTVRSPSPPHFCLILCLLLHASSSRKASRSPSAPPEASGLDGPSSVLHLGVLCLQLPPLPVPQALHTVGAPGGRALALAQ